MFPLDAPAKIAKDDELQNWFRELATKKEDGGVGLQVRTNDQNIRSIVLSTHYMC